MKTLIIIVLLLVAGCIPTTQQVETLTNDVDKLMVAVDNYQEKFAEEVDRVQADIVVVNEAVKEKADESVVEQLTAANEASRPFNPYAPMIDIALKILAGTGVLYGAPKIIKTVRERNELANKYSAAKVGMDKFRNENPDKAAELYNDVGDARKAKKIA